MEGFILDLVPSICVLCGIITTFFLLRYFIKSYYVNQSLLTEKKLQHERDMKTDEWERKKAWETMLSISRIVNIPYVKLAEEIENKKNEIEQLKPMAEKAAQLDVERATQEKVMLIYQLFASKEEVTQGKVKEKQGQIKEIYDSIKNMLK